MPCRREPSLRAGSTPNIARRLSARAGAHPSCVPRLTADGERASGRAPSAGRCRGVDRMGGGRMPHVLGETAPVAGGTARAGVGDHPVGDAEARRQPNACGGAPSDEPACDPRDADSRRAGRREHGHYLVVTCFRSSRHIRMRAAQTFTCAPESPGVTRTPRGKHEEGACSIACTCGCRMLAEHRRRRR